MGHAMSKYDKLDNIEFRDFKSVKPVNVRAVRSGDEIYFMDDNRNLYSSRIIRREKWAFPLTLNHRYMIKALFLLKYFTKEEHDKIIQDLEGRRRNEEIRSLESDIASQEKRLKKLKEQS